MTDYYVCKQNFQHSAAKYYGPYTLQEKEAIMKLRGIYPERFCIWKKIGKISDGAFAPSKNTGAWYTILTPDGKYIDISENKEPLWRKLVEMKATDDHSVLKIYRGMYQQ